MEYNYLVSFITINYNGQELTCSLLDSIYEKLHGINYEVIVVDNASKNDEASEIQKRFPQAKIIRSDTNLGFAGGNNLGIRNAEGDYLFFINNDTEILSGDITELCNTLSHDSMVGIVCPKIRFSDGTIQFAGYTPMSRVALRNDLIGFMQNDVGQYEEITTTPFAHGAAMMVRHSTIDTVGYMPECYFLYFEELDWSLMFARKGYRILYNPAFTILHKESATVGQESPLRSYYMTRNRQIFAYRNRTGISRILSILYTRYLSSFKRIIQALVNHRFDNVKAIIRANFDYLTLDKTTLKNSI